MEPKDLYGKNKIELDPDIEEYIKPIRNYFTAMLWAWIELTSKDSPQWDLINSEPDRYKAIDILRDLAIEHWEEIGALIQNDMLAPAPLLIDWEGLISRIKIARAKSLIWGESENSPGEL